VKSKYITIFIFVLIVAVIANLGITNINQASNPVLGSDSKGTVTKDIYSHSGNSDHKIAIITGMHPREVSSKEVVPEVIKEYTAKHNVEIVNYQINVTDQPGNYQIGRNNGEALVAKYVIPDIKKSNYDMVIICHNHIQSYGDGYYIATPTMDNKSVDLAMKTHNLLPDFNYYQRNVNQIPDRSSIKGVDYPIVATGTPVFVYEIPGDAGNNEVYYNTNRLIDSVFKVIG